MILVLVMFFTAVAVFGRVAIQYKITGDHGLRPAKRNSSLLVKVTSLLWLGSSLFIVVLGILDAIGLYSAQGPTLLKYCGATVSVVGVALTFTAQNQMGASWRVGVDEEEKTELINHGLYAHVRNPIYTGVFIFGLGLLLVSPSFYMLLCIIGVAASIEAHVRYVEEPYLAALHGKLFDQYVKTTGRYWPKFNKEASQP